MTGCVLAQMLTMLAALLPLPPTGSVRTGHPVRMRHRGIRTQRLTLVAASMLEDERDAAARMHAEALAYSEATYHSGSLQSAAKAAFGPADWDSYGFPGVGSGLGADATAPSGFGEDELARVSRRPLFSAAECAAVINEAEAAGAWEESGSISHYARRAGCLTPLSALPKSLEWIRHIAWPVIEGAIQSAFPHGGASTSLRVSDARLVKYNASASQTQLGLHRDGPPITATVALSRLDEYVGGGTVIEALAGRVGGGMLSAPVCCVWTRGTPCFTPAACGMGARPSAPACVRRAGSEPAHERDPNPRTSGIRAHA